MYIADPATDDATIGQLNTEIESLIKTEGGTVINTDDMGRRPLAYRINKHTEGYYYLFEIEGSGKEIAELERRLRVNDKIVRYLTVRVDEERKAAAKIEAKRALRKEKLKASLGNKSSEDEEE